MQEMMINCKVRPQNRLDDLMRIEREYGKVNINEFYGKEEGSINDV